jgi:hypothetical protein
MVIFIIVNTGSNVYDQSSFKISNGSVINAKNPKAELKYENFNNRNAKKFKFTCFSVIFVNV